MHLDERTNAVIVRDTPEVMAVIERLVASLDIAQSEVTMDVQVLEVNTNDVLDVGVDYPAELRFSVLPKEGSDRVTVGDLLGLNRDGIGVGGSNGGDLGAAIKLLQRQGKTKVLANPKIRVRNMEKASIKIGEKVPVVTTTNANGVVTESVNYQDVGLILQVEPRISLSNEVSVKVNMEVSNLKSEVKTAGGGTVYPMSTRNAETVMTARDGETQVLAGLVKQQHDRSSSGLPGLSTLSWLGGLFGSQKRGVENTELILLLTPRIERALDLPAASNSYFHSGTESRLSVEPLRTEAQPPAAAPARDTSAPALDSPLAAP
ncbi:type II secretion system protein GspD [Chromobacterium sp. Beijing]|uniref:type II secretion system protein GspD n=1 Tax=Chromobacterium sp. Beijing TaxID=2735795 RepID=UPI00351D7CDE